jgi:antitoxin VapB
LAAVCPIAAVPPRAPTRGDEHLVSDEVHRGSRHPVQQGHHRLTQPASSAHNSNMMVSITDEEIERLATEVAALTGESRAGAIRNALRERKERLVVQPAAGDRERVLRSLLEKEIWPALPTEMIGRGPTGAEQEAILG